MADPYEGLDDLVAPVAPAPTPAPVQAQPQPDPYAELDSFTAPAPAPVEEPQPIAPPAQAPASPYEYDLRGTPQPGFMTKFYHAAEDNGSEGRVADYQSRINKYNQLNPDKPWNKSYKEPPSHEELDAQLWDRSQREEARKSQIKEANSGYLGNVDKFIGNTANSILESGRSVHAKAAEFVLNNPKLAAPLTGGASLFTPKAARDLAPGFNRISKESQAKNQIYQAAREESVKNLPKPVARAATMMADLFPRLATGGFAPVIFAAEAYTSAINDLEKRNDQLPPEQRMSRAQMESIALFSGGIQAFTPPIFRGAGPLAGQLVGKGFKAEARLALESFAKEYPTLVTQRVLDESVKRLGGIDDGEGIFNGDKMLTDIVGSVIAGGMNYGFSRKNKVDAPTAVKKPEISREEAQTVRDEYDLRPEQTVQKTDTGYKVDETSTVPAGIESSRAKFKEYSKKNRMYVDQAINDLGYEPGKLSAQKRQAVMDRVEELKTQMALSELGLYGVKGKREGLGSPQEEAARVRSENEAQDAARREVGLAGAKRQQEIAARQDVHMHPPMPPLAEAPLKAANSNDALGERMRMKEPIEGLGETEARERRGRERFASDEEVIREKLKAKGYSDEQIKDFESEGFLAPDRVTGFTEARAGEARSRTVERALAHVEKTGEKGVYVDADLKNLGGLNKALTATGADKAYRAMSALLKEELHKIGADVHLFRHGGDEMSAVIINADKATVDAAMLRAKNQVEALAKKEKWDTIPHTKEGREGGTGIHFGSTEVNPVHSIEETIKIAEAQTEARKGSNDYGTGQAQAVGGGKSAGEPAPASDAGKTGRAASIRPRPKQGSGENTQRSPKGGEAASNEPVAQKEGIGSADSAARGSEKAVDSGQGRESAGSDTQYLKGPRYDIPVNLSEKGTEKPISNHAIIERIRRDRGLPIEYGHTGKKDALGFYKVHDRIVREQSQEAGDLAIATHEVAHDIDRHQAVSGPLSPHTRDMLGLLDYDINRKDPSEGFAEAVRMYITNDSQLTPEARAWLEGEFKRSNPKDFTDISRYKKLADQWKAQSPEERVGANLATGGENPHTGLVTLPEKIKDWVGEKWDQAYRYFKDESSSLGVYDKAAKKGGYKDIGAQEEFRFQAKRAEVNARRAFEDGVFDLQTGKKIGPSFKEAMQDVSDAKDFERYLWANHALEVYSKHKGEQNPGMSYDEAKAIVDRVQNDPERGRIYTRNQKVVKRYNNALVDMLVESGVMSSQEGAAIKNAYATYIPLMRVKLKDKFAKGSGGPLEVNNPVKTRTGSGLPVDSPLEHMLANTVTYYSEAAKQQVVNRIVSVAKKTPGLGAFIHKVDFHEGRPDKDAHQIRVFENGKPEIYQLNKDMYSFARGMEKEQLNAFMKILSVPASVAKLGYTGLSLTFAPKNFIRDYVQYMTQKGNGRELRGAVAPAEMISKYILSRLHSPDAMVELWRENGGELAGFHGADAKRLRKTVEDYAKQSIGKSLFKLVDHPVETLRDVIGVVEVGPRLAEFRRVLDETGYDSKRIADLRSRGERPPKDVLIKAMIASKDVTLDFSRQGSIGKQINAIIPFFNAGLEGTDRTVRLFKNNPKRAFIAMSAYAAAGVAYWLTKKDQDEYKREPDWVKYGAWTITDDSGKPVVRIPRNEHGMMMAGIEAILNKAYNNDPDSVKGWAIQVADRLNPLDVPTALKAPMEVYGNKNMFTGAPIESSSMQKLSPENRSNEYTTEFMKQAGKMLGVSPAKLQHLADSWTGGIYRSAATKYDVITGKQELANTDIPGIGGMLFRKEYTDSQGKFREKYTSIDQKFNDARKDGTLTPTQITEHKRWDLLKDFESRLSAIEGADKYVAGLADYALGREELGRYPNPLTASNLPPEVADAKAELIKRAREILSQNYGPPTKLERIKGLTQEKKTAQIKAQKEAAQALMNDLNKIAKK